MICVSDRELAVIRGILKKYAPDCEARAFGSRYTWTSNEYSDLDLALTGKAKLGLSCLGRIRDAFEESELPFRVDVLDWHCLSKEFQSIINKGYEVIYTPEKEQWEKVRLGDVAEIIGGFAFKGQDFSETDGDIRVVKITDITPPTIDYQNTLFIDSSKYDKCKLEKYLIKNKDFVVAMTGATIGKIGRLQCGHNAYINQRVAKITAVDGVDKDFVYYAISGRDFHGFINNHIDSNSVQANISATSIGNFHLLLPPLPTQRVIAATLSCLDDKIALNNRINANLEAQAQAIFKSWFVDFEPFKDGKFVNSELGRIPEGWRVGRLKDLCFYSDTKIAVNNLTTLTYISTENMLPNKAGYTQSSSLPSIAQTQEILQGDVLVSNIRPYFKKIVFGNFTGGCSADVLCFRPIDQYYSAFIYYTLYEDKFFDYMVAGSKGTKMPRGDKQHIMNYPIIIPTSDDFIRFSDLIAPLSSLKGSMLIESRTLAAIRDALLPKLMSREIEVEEEEADTLRRNL